MTARVTMSLSEICFRGNETRLNLMEVLLDDASCLDNISSYSWNENDTTGLTQLLRDFKKSLYLFHEPRTVVLLCLYALVFVLSVIGNSLVLTVILSQRGQRSSTSLFLLVMALSDLLVATICVPTTMTQAVYRGWLLGEIFCKLTAYAQGVAVTSSIYTVVLMILDRFLSIKHSALLKRMNSASYTKMAVAFIWIVSGLFMIPLLAVRTTESVDILPTEAVYFCVERWSSSRKQLTFSVAVFLFVYAVPCGMMAALYSALGKELWSSEPDRMMQRRDSTVSVASSRAIIGRRRVARTSVFVAAAFVLCWLPYHIFDTVVHIEYRHTNNTMLAGYHFTKWLAHANCAIKPVLYCFMGTTFRRKMIRLVKKCNPVCKREVFTVAYQMDPSNFQWTLADYGLANGASPRPSFASWNTSLPSPLSCYSLHWPLYDHTPRASISTQSRSYQHSPRSSVGFLSPHDDYSPRGSFCTETRGDNTQAMCFLDTPPFLSPRTSVSTDRRGSSVSQQRSPRPSISVDPSRKSPRIAVSFEDHDSAFRSPRSSFSTEERLYRIPRSPRQSFCSEELVYGPPGRHYEEKQMYLTTKPYVYYQQDDRRTSRRSSAYADHNVNLLSPTRRTFCTDDRFQVRRQSMSTMKDYPAGDTQPPEVVYSSPTPPVPSIPSPDQSEEISSPDHEKSMKKNSTDQQTDSENDFSPSEMITYNSTRRQSLASNASRISTKASSPRSDKSDAKHRHKLKKQQVSTEHNRSRRSSVATIAESVDNRSVDNRSRRESVITLAELQDNRSRRNSVNTLGDNMENRSRRSSVITLGDAFENMMRGSRNTLAESPSNRSQRSSPHSRSPSQRSSPHNQMELELSHNSRAAAPTSTAPTPSRRASVAAMGDSVDSSGTVKEKRRASCSDFSETTHDSKERPSALHQQHSFPFGKHEEKHRRPSCAAIEVVDEFLSRRSSLQVNQNDGLEDVRSRSGSRSRSRTPSPNTARRDSIPIQRTSPRASPKQIMDEESDDEPFRPISEVPDSTSRVIEWKKGLDKERASNDLNEKKAKRKHRAGSVHHHNSNNNVKETKPEQETTLRKDKPKKREKDNYTPMQEYRPPKLNSTSVRRSSYSNEPNKPVRPQRRSSVYAETALCALNEDEQTPSTRERTRYRRGSPVAPPRMSPTNPEPHQYSNRTRDIYYDEPPPGYNQDQAEWTVRPKPRRASIHAEDRRAYEPASYFMVRDSPRHAEPLYYREAETEFIDHLYDEHQFHPQPMIHERKLPETPKGALPPEYGGRRHSYVEIHHPQPYCYVDKTPPPRPTKRRASVALVSHDPEELMHLIRENKQMQHAAAMQKRASLPVVEGIPSVYYPQMRDQFDPRNIPINNRAVHIAYQGAHLASIPDQRPIPKYPSHQAHKRSSSPYEENRSRSRSVSWQCDDVEEEDEEGDVGNDVRSSLLKSKYMEIAT